MTDGIMINGKHSFYDYGLYLDERDIQLPAKKAIKDTVPYMSGSYDFSSLYGEPAWENREISYAFDIVGATVREMETIKAAVLDWLMNANDIEIYDDSIPGYHFEGSYCDNDWSEDGEQGSLTVIFDCSPFRIANVATAQTITPGTSMTILNDGQSVIPIAIAAATASITVNGVSQSLVASAETELAMRLKRGANIVSATGANVTLKWYEAVM